MQELKIFLRRLKFIIVKELLTTIKDPRVRTILILPVIVQSIVFGYASTYNLDNVPYALLDHSRSALSAEFAARLDGTGIFHRVVTLQSSAQIAACIDSDAALLVVTIPQDFADRLHAGQQTPLQIITDGRNTTTAGIVAGYVSSVAADFNAWLHEGRQLLKVETISWYNPNLITRWMFLPAMLGLLTFLQTMILAGLSVAKEREQGTFDQLLVTPLTPGEILLGKAVPPILIGLLQATLVLLVARFWFAIPFAGSLLTLYLTLFIFLASSMGIGLSISAISKNMQQVMVYCFVLLLPMTLLSGMATPVRSMPEALQYATYANPLRFAIDAFRRIYLEGCGVGDIALNFIPMLIIAAVTMPTAAWLFRNKLS